MFEIKKVSEGLYEIEADKADAKLLDMAIERKPVSVIHLCLRVIQSVCNTASAYIYSRI